MALVTGGGGSIPALAAGKVSLTSGDITTASATFVDLTGVTATLTTGAHRCLVTVAGIFTHSGSGADVFFDFAVDGTRVGGTNGLWGATNNTASFNNNMSTSFLTDVLTAASHTIKVQWRTSGATATVRASATSPIVFAVSETLLAA